MTTLQDFLFKVEKVDNPLNAVSAQSKQIIGYPKGIKTVMNTCSDSYQLIKNENLYPEIEATLNEANCTYDKHYEMNDDMTVFNATYTIKEINGIDVGIDLGNNDKIYMTIGQGNSYNGYKNGHSYAGFFRMICSNGLVIPLEGKEETNFMVSGKHTKKLAISFKNLMPSILEFISMQDVYKKRFNVLTDRVIVNYGERIEAVLEATKVKASKPQLESIIETAKLEAIELYSGKVNDFLVYNAINAHIFKGVDSKGNISKATNDVKIAKDAKVLAYIMN